MLAAAVGRRLTEARERAGLEQQDVARHLGIVRQTLSNYEHGRTEAPYNTLHELCLYYDITLASLFDGDPTNRWTLVVDVPAGLAPSELIERIEDEPGVSVVETHFEDMIERGEGPEEVA